MSAPGPKVWFAALHHPAALLLIATLLVSLALTARLPTSPRFLLVLHDAAHAPFSAGIALLVFAGLGHWRSAPKGRGRHWLAFGLTLLVGAAVEVAQSFVGRGMSLYDLYTDALGAACALAGLAWWRSRRSPDARGRARLAAGAAVLTGALAAAPVLEAGLAYAQRAAQFPVIASFASPLGRTFLTIHSATATRTPLPAPWRQPDDPRASLRLALLPGSWPGVGHNEPARDWRGFAALNVDVTNPSTEPLPLTLRVHDAAHDLRHADRFNRDFVVPPGTRQVLRVPLVDIEAGPVQRRLDLAHAAGLILFVTDAGLPPGRQLYVTRIWLD